jgi:hypothetical protein
MVITVVEATFQTPRIEAERDQQDHVHIDKIRRGSVSLDPDQAVQVAAFILATNPMRDPGTCQICGHQKDSILSVDR